MTHDDKARLKLDIALARALLDEVERFSEPDPRVVGQLVEELARVTESLSERILPATPSGVRLHVA